MMFIDTHCHLDDEQFAGDLNDVLARAEQAGVQAIITAGVDVESSRAAIALAERFEIVYAVVGIHPQHAATGNPENLAAIRELAAHRKVVGIGEIGLDLYRAIANHHGTPLNSNAPGFPPRVDLRNPPREVQEKNFIAHLDLAAELGKPVVIHNRNADDAVMEILRKGVQLNAPTTGILHCFSGDLAMARDAIDLGYLISFAGNVTFKNATRLQAIARALPLDRIVIETDAPYLSPLRGTRNEPANAARVAEKIAELQQIDVALVAQIMTRNSGMLFRLDTSEDF